MRCKHKNGELLEMAVIVNAKSVTNGILSDIGDNNIGNIIGYRYICADCEREFSFTANPSQKWLKKIYLQIGDKL